MNYTESDRLCAGAKLWLAKMYVADITDFAAGDASRFSRMVDGRGAGCGSLAQWLINLANIAKSPTVQHFHNDKLIELLESLNKTGYTLQEAK